MTELIDKTSEEIVSLVRTREISSLELVRHTLALVENTIQFWGALYQSIPAKTFSSSRRKAILEEAKENRRA
jgi:transcription elongation factor GreA-like protein